jgi:hypothetical protein
METYLPFFSNFDRDFYSDNSTRILSTNQIYEIGQYGPITLVLKKCLRKFSLFIDELL